MRDDFRQLAHAGLTFNAPLSEERASRLVAALPIAPGHHVLDFGCGWGELLLRILAAQTTGISNEAWFPALDKLLADAPTPLVLDAIKKLKSPHFDAALQ